MYVYFCTKPVTDIPNCDMFCVVLISCSVGKVSYIANVDMLYICTPTCNNVSYLLCLNKVFLICAVRVLLLLSSTPHPCDIL